jgi:hypothetical protein
METTHTHQSRGPAPSWTAGTVNNFQLPSWAGITFIRQPDQVKVRAAPEL